jgi:hypothetical protein
MTKEINYPEVTTWFICWSNEREVLKAYGVVLPSQTMSTFWDVIDTYIDEDTWNKELKDNGIQVKKINNADTNE